MLLLSHLSSLLLLLLNSVERSSSKDNSAEKYKLSYAVSLASSHWLGKGSTSKLDAFLSHAQSSSKMSNPSGGTIHSLRASWELVFHGI